MIVLIKSRARAAALLAEWAERVAGAAAAAPPRRTGPSAPEARRRRLQRGELAPLLPRITDGRRRAPETPGPGRPAPQARRPLWPDARG